MAKPKDEPKPKPKRKDCPRCNGTGKVAVQGSGRLSDWIPCVVGEP
jgi:hypothetical protein